jgi:Putative metallopeptidase
MLKTYPRGAAIAALMTLMMIPPASAQQLPAGLQNPNVEIVYKEPRTAAFKPIAERVKQRRVLEQLRVFLAPLRLPRKLTVNVEECGAPMREYKPQGPVIICYEVIDQIEKIAAKADANMREHVLIGAVVQAAFHETAHAVFDILQVPVWGRANDAADRLAAFIMVHFGEDVALQTILGTAEFFRLSGHTWTGSEFAEVNSPEAQRFYNYLCIALGGAPKSFIFLVNPKDKQEQLLPDRRAERCKGEFEQVRMAFDLRIMPYVDPDILVKVRAVQWAIPLNGRQ